MPKPTKRDPSRATSTSRDDLPEIVSEVRDPGARERYRRAVAEIERHPRAPAKYHRKREDLRRFLEGTMPDHVRVARPWCRRAWRSLRREVPSDPAARAEWLADLFALAWTAQAAGDHDEASRATMRAARAAAPTRRQVDRLKCKWRERERRLDPALPPEEREAFRRERLCEYRFTVPDGRELIGWLAVGDLLRPKRGDDPRTLFDSPAELLMGYLTASLRLPARSAATLTADLLRWTLGRGESEDRFRDAWRWRRANPSKVPAQP